MPVYYVITNLGINTRLKHPMFAQPISRPNMNLAPQNIAMSPQESMKKTATDRARLHDALDAVLDGAGRATDAGSSVIYVDTARELKRVVDVLRTSYLAIIAEAGQASNGKFGCRALVSRNTALKAIKEAGATTAKVTPG